MLPVGRPPAKLKDAAREITSAVHRNFFIPHASSKKSIHLLDAAEPQLVAADYKLQSLITLADRIALVIIHELVVRPQAVVCVLAPEGPIVAVRNRGIPGGFDV